MEAEIWKVIRELEDAGVDSGYIMEYLVAFIAKAGYGSSAIIMLQEKLTKAKATGEEGAS